MRSIARFAPVVLAAASLATGTAHAQDSFWNDDADLGGTWFAPGGSVEIKTPGLFSSTYTIAGTGALTGKGKFDGSSFTFTPETGVGMAGKLSGQKAPAASPVSLAYTSGSNYDWLIGNGVTLYRAHSKDKNLNGPWSKPEPQVVNPERIQGLFDNLRDVQGNNDRIANEGTQPNLTDAQRLQAAMDFLAQKEKAWGEPVTDLKASDFESPDLYNFFRAEKAIELSRFHRTPDDVKDFYLNVTGSVEGQTINPRKIFAQLWKAPGVDSPVIGAVIPGYRDTGRTFADQVQLANKAGADMITMDAQWSGWTQGGHSGGVDSGQGIARDAYAFAGWVQNKFAGKKLFLMGSSLGGGPGTYGTLCLASEGQAEVTVDDGTKKLAGHDLLSPATPAIIQAPFLAIHHDVSKDWKAVEAAFANFKPWELKFGFDFGKLDSNDFAELWGKIPFLKTHEFHSETPAHNDGDRADDVKNLLSREDGSASQAQAMDATLPFGREIVEKIHMGLGPRGPVYVIHAKDDTLADYKTSAGVVADMQKQGRSVQLTTLNSDHHTFWNQTSEMGSFLPYLHEIMGK
jgi:hypothetical protein